MKLMDSKIIAKFPSSSLLPPLEKDNQQLQVATSMTNAVLQVQKEVNTFLQQPCCDYRHPSLAFPNAKFANLSTQREVGELVIGFPAECTLWDVTFFRAYKIVKENLLPDKKEDVLDRLLQLYIRAYPNQGYAKRDVRASFTEMINLVQDGCNRLRKTKFKIAAERVQQLQKAIFLLNFTYTYYGAEFCGEHQYIYSIPDAFAEKSHTGVYPPERLIEFCQFCLSILQKLDSTSSTISGVINFVETVCREQMICSWQFFLLTAEKEEEEEICKLKKSKLHAAIHRQLAECCHFWTSDYFSLSIRRRTEYIFSCIFLSLNLQQWKENKKNPLLDTSQGVNKEPPLSQVNKLVTACKEINEKMGKRLKDANLKIALFFAKMQMN